MSRIKHDSSINPTDTDYIKIYFTIWISKTNDLFSYIDEREQKCSRAIFLLFQRIHNIYD